MSPSGPAGDIRLAVDIGGTFTDLALTTPTGLVTTKVLTTPGAPADGVLIGIDELLAEAGVEAGAVQLVVHGTTLATNALIERRGARTALLTTEGLRDALEMAQENRFAQYDISSNRPEPLVPRYLRLPVRERLNWRGEVLTELDESSVAALLPVLREHAIESVAIGLLHAYANPAHEQRVAELIGNALPDVYLSLSSEVCPEVREYERQSTTCANAYVRPVMSHYLMDLRSGLDARGLRCEMLLMSSAGTLMSLEAARRFPIRLVESGPAGGAILAAQIAADERFDSVLSFDMGGTTAKICLIDEATPMTSRSFEVARAYRFMRGSGLPVRIPVIEMVEIGAGGGSLASVDSMGRIRVGPRSAGSEPGPASYGRGGEYATVTDADLVLGKLDPTRFAGGRFQLDATRAAEVLGIDVGQKLGLSSDDAAFGVAEVVEENMASAARMHAVEWGQELPGRVMVAFGGAAPLHAARLAQKLDIQTVIVPRGAGVGSALGFLRAPVAYEVVRSRYATLESLGGATLTQLFAEMREEAAELVRTAAPDAPLTEQRHAYMRYLGQGHEIAVPVARDADTSVLRQSFEQAYRGLFGRTIPNLEVEVLSWTLSLAAPETPIAWQSQDEAASNARADGMRLLFDQAGAQRVEAATVARQGLSAQRRVDGPALIEEDQTTTVVPRDWRAVVTAAGHLRLDFQPVLQEQTQ